MPPLLKSIEASGLRDEQVVVISFDADAIAECERRKPALKTQWLARYERTDEMATAHELDLIPPGRPATIAEPERSEAARG